jgi:hypothetical protein
LTKKTKGCLWFYRKRLITKKIGWKSIFQPRAAHILSHLDVSVLYKKIRSFEKYRVLAQKLKGLAYGFTGKHLFATKKIAKIRILTP